MQATKPRVLRIINRLNLGGPTYNAAYLTKYLEPEFETLLVSGMKDEEEESSEFIMQQLGIQPVYVPEMYRELNPLRDYKSYFRLRKIIRDFKPHIVHTHAAKAGAVGRLAAHHEGVKNIVHTFHGHVFHGYFNPLKTKTFIAIERYLAHISAAIVTLSPAQLNELTKVYHIAPREKFRIIPLGFDLLRFTEGQEQKRTTFRQQLQIADDEVAIGIVGRLVPIKNHELFLRGIQQLMQTAIVPFKAVIIGDGEERIAIEALARELQIPFEASEPATNRLLFTGWRKDVDVCNAGLDVVCLTSKNEGTPVSLIEAQASGKPIVSTRVGGIEDVVAENQSALLCASGDVNGFASQLARLVNDAALRQQMSGQSRDFVLKQFSYERLCSDMSVLYRELLSRPQ